MVFPPHLHPSTPRLSALFAQVLKSASRRINNISKGQVEDKGRDGAMTGAFPAEKGGWFFGWFFFGSSVDSFLVLWFFGWGIKDKTSELEVKVHKNLKR